MAEAVLPESQIKWKWYIESYDRIRDSIADVFDESMTLICAFINQAVFTSNIQLISTSEYKESGKAQFLITPLEEVYADKENQVRCRIYRK